jgi:hypothetical protein
LLSSTDVGNFGNAKFRLVIDAVRLFFFLPTFSLFFADNEKEAAQCLSAQPPGEQMQGVP